MELLLTEKCLSMWTKIMSNKFCPLQTFFENPLTGPFDRVWRTGSMWKVNHWCYFMCT